MENFFSEWLKCRFPAGRPALADWSDVETAFRAGFYSGPHGAGSVMEFVKHEAGEEGWSEWVCPKPESYLMKCCDCGLVHELQFRVAHYEPRPSEDFSLVDDANTQAQFRARRER